jgi:hypothetical protein
MRAVGERSRYDPTEVVGFGVDAPHSKWTQFLGREQKRAPRTGCPKLKQEGNEAAWPSDLLRANLPDLPLVLSSKQVLVLTRYWSLVVVRTVFAKSSGRFSQFLGQSGRQMGRLPKNEMEAEVKVFKPGRDGPNACRTCIDPSIAWPKGRVTRGRTSLLAPVLCDVLEVCIERGCGCLEGGHSFRLNCGEEAVPFGPCNSCHFLDRVTSVDKAPAE